MKLMKRLAAMLLAVCLVVPCASLAVNAADGLIFFTDLEGISVGETFTITGSVVNRDGNLSQVDLTMSYDSTAMRYVGGDDNVTDQGDGTLVYSGSVDGSRLDFDMQFEALIQGETRLEQESAEVTDANGDTLNLLDPPGYSDVQIVEGDGTAASSSTTALASGVTLTVNDTEYTVASSYPDSELPAGFVSADITVGGETVTGASQENGSAQLVYLLDGNNDGAFFLYNSEDNTASPIQIVTLTSGSTLILLGDRGDVTLPARYQEVELDISDTQTLPAWQDSKNSRYYLMNALNASGDRALYRYDSTDQTYQYYGDDVTTTASGTNSDSGIFGRVSTFVQDHVDVVMIGAGFAFLVLLLLIIILAVKLHRRNLELDDVYDELDELTKKKVPTDREDRSAEVRAERARKIFRRFRCLKSSSMNLSSTVTKTSRSMTSPKTKSLRIMTTTMRTSKTITRMKKSPMKTVTMIRITMTLKRIMKIQSRLKNPDVVKRTTSRIMMMTMIFP